MVRDSPRIEFFNGSVYIQSLFECFVHFVFLVYKTRSNLLVEDWIYRWRRIAIIVQNGGDCINVDHEYLQHVDGIYTTNFGFNFTIKAIRWTTYPRTRVKVGFLLHSHMSCLGIGSFGWRWRVLQQVWNVRKRC